MHRYLSRIIERLYLREKLQRVPQSEIEHRYCDSLKLLFISLLLFVKYLTQDARAIEKPTIPVAMSPVFGDTSVIAKMGIASANTGTIILTADPASPSRLLSRPQHNAITLKIILPSFQLAINYLHSFLMKLREVYEEL